MQQPVARTALAANPTDCPTRRARPAITAAAKRVQPTATTTRRSAERHRRPLSETVTRPALDPLYPDDLKAAAPRAEPSGAGTGISSRDGATESHGWRCSCRLRNRRNDRLVRAAAQATPARNERRINQGPSLHAGRVVRIASHGVGVTDGDLAYRRTAPTARAAQQGAGRDTKYRTSDGRRSSTSCSARGLSERSPPDAGRTPSWLRRISADDSTATTPGAAGGVERPAWLDPAGTGTVHTDHRPHRSRGTTRAGETAGAVCRRAFPAGARMPVVRALTRAPTARARPRRPS